MGGVVWDSMIAVLAITRKEIQETTDRTDVNGSSSSCSTYHETLMLRTITDNTEKILSQKSRQSYWQSLMQGLDLGCLG